MTGVWKIVLILTLHGFTGPLFVTSQDVITGTKVECSKNEMKITIERKNLEEMGPNSLRLRDPKCLSRANATHFLLTTPLTGCGTTIRHTDKTVVYTNAVMEKETDGLITRLSDIDVPFSCFYYKEGITSTLGLLPLLIQRFISGTNSTAKFDLSMRLFKDRAFKQSYRAIDFPLKITLNTPLFVEVQVNSQDARLSVMADRCFATPSQNIYDRVTYDVIRKGCPLDPTLEFLPAEAFKKRFTFKSFHFVGGNQKFVFMHCQLIVCNASNPMSRCANGCAPSSIGNRLRRSSQDEIYDITQGPIIVVEENENTRKNEMATSPLYVWLFVAMVAVCIGCLAVVVLMRKQFSRARKEARQEVPVSEVIRETIL